MNKESIILFHDTNKMLIYNRSNGTIGVGDPPNREVIDAIEDYFEIQIQETKCFQKQIGNYFVSNYPLSNGLLTIQKKII